MSEQLHHLQVGENSRPMLIARAALVHYAERGDKITEQRVER